jgi:hypothetical protein
MAKEPRSVKLASALEGKMLELQGTWVGENLSEIITFILKDWLKSNREFVADLRNEGRSRRQRNTGSRAGRRTTPQQ